MNEQQNSSLNHNAKYNSADTAQPDTKKKASWLIYLSRDFGKAFRRGKNEIDLVVDSTKSAFRTTKRITRRITMRPEREPDLIPDDEFPEEEDAPESAGAEKPTITAPPGKKSKRSKKNKKKRKLSPKTDVSMTDSEKPKTKWYSPMELADRANDQFLSVARSTGKTMGFIQSGTMDNLSKVKHTLSRKKKKEKFEEQTQPVKDELLAQDASPVASAPPPGNGKAKGPLKNLSVPTSNKGPHYPPLDLEAFLKQHSPQDKGEALRLRKILSDLLLGSEAARWSALQSLVGLRQVAEPFMVASLQAASPEVAEIALAGLSQIGSQRLIGCISDVHTSPDSELRIVALRAAQRLTDEEARPFLARGLRDPNAKVKRRALSYLSWHDSPWALAEIRRLCNDPDPEVKWAALEALLTVRPSETYANLKMMMPTLDPAYQSRALTMLEQQKSLEDKDSGKENPLASAPVSSTADAGEKAKEKGPEKKNIQKKSDTNGNKGALSKKAEKKGSSPAQVKKQNEDD